MLAEKQGIVKPWATDKRKIIDRHLRKDYPFAGEI